MRTILKNGHLVDPSAGRDGLFDIMIEDGVVTAVEQGLVEDSATVIDVSNKYILPGLIDLHVHLREPGFEYKETIRTGSLAAAKGGYTTICPMPNTKPAIDSACMIEYMKLKEKEDAVIHICPVGAITKSQNGQELTDTSAMVQKGALAISEDGKSVMEPKLYLEAMKEAAKAGIPIFAHCEDKDLVGHGVMNAGYKAEQLGLEGISNAVEDVIVARDILLAKEAKATLHLCHCSTEDSVKLVKMAKEMGLPVTAEVCPHHFTLTEDDILCDDSNYKMNPPLRSKNDVRALKEGLQQNIMDVISTDHAPHSEEEKTKSMAVAPFGIVGSETAFALSYTELVKGGYLTLSQLVEKMSVNPARILGINKGSLQVGMAADLCVVELDHKYQIDVNKFVSKGKNSPFHGREVYGSVELTMVDGSIVYENK